MNIEMNSSPSILSKKLLIAEVTNQLCKDMNFQDITINLICKNANISRASFYRVFDSKYEIPLWCQSFALEAGLREIGRTLTYVEGLTVTHEGLMLFRPLMRSVILHSDPYSIDEVGYHKYIEDMVETLTVYKGIVIDNELQFQIEFTALAGAQTCKRWLAGKIDADATNLAALLDSCVPVRLRSILNEPVNRQPVGNFDLASLVFAASNKRA